MNDGGFVFLTETVVVLVDPIIMPDTNKLKGVTEREEGYDYQQMNLHVFGTWKHFTTPFFISLLSLS